MATTVMFQCDSVATSAAVRDQAQLEDGKHGTESALGANLLRVCERGHEKYLHELTGGAPMLLSMEFRRRRAVESAVP
jgi:hypothetical protein